MNDREFFELQLRATICAQQARWPAPELWHWQKLHEVPDEARERVSRAHTQMDEIDADRALSPEGKQQRRHRVAAQAIADLEASKTLARSREAVRHVIEQWDRDDVSLEIAEARAALLKTMKEAEAGWQRAIDLISERACLSKGSNTRRELLLHSSEGRRPLGFRP